MVGRGAGVLVTRGSFRVKADSTSGLLCTRTRGGLSDWNRQGAPDRVQVGLTSKCGKKKAEAQGGEGVGLASSPCEWEFWRGRRASERSEDINPSSDPPDSCQGCDPTSVGVPRSPLFAESCRISSKDPPFVHRNRAPYFVVRPRKSAAARRAWTEERTRGRSARRVRVEKVE